MSADFDHREFPRRLNLGCGFDRREGYLNVDLHDFHEPDLVADVRDLEMLPDDYYEEVLAIDVLEHLPRTATAATLREWRRVLVPGGLLHLRVPSVEALSQLFQESDSFERHQELMQCLFGTQAYTGDYHLTSFTRILLEGFLDEAGFDVISLVMKDEWLFDALACARDGDGAPGEPSPEARLVEIATRIPDDRAFLDTAYRSLLGRAPDEEGAAFYLEGLGSGALTRDAVVEHIMQSEEFRERKATGEGNA